MTGPLIRPNRWDFFQSKRATFFHAQIKSGLILAKARSVLHWCWQHSSKCRQLLEYCRESIQGRASEGIHNFQDEANFVFAFASSGWTSPKALRRICSTSCRKCHIAFELVLDEVNIPQAAVRCDVEMLLPQQLEVDLQRLFIHLQRLLELALAAETFPKLLYNVGMLWPQHLEIDLQRLSVRPQHFLAFALVTVNIPGCGATWID